jgi:hypothetical protein
MGKLDLKPGPKQGSRNNKESQIMGHDGRCDDRGLGALWRQSGRMKPNRGEFVTGPGKSKGIEKIAQCEAETNNLPRDQKDQL